MRARELALLIISVFIAGCGPRRTVGPGKPFAYYDYCVMSPGAMQGYDDYKMTEAALAPSCTILRPDDPRLEQPDVRQKACTISIDWRRGFWSSSAWVQVREFGTDAPILTTSVRGGMMWMGISGDVSDAIHDVASVRAQNATPLSQTGAAAKPDISQ